MRDGKPYVVGCGYYCEEVGRYATFAEAKAHYGRLGRPRRLWNEDRVDVDDPAGLTAEEAEALAELD